MNVIVDRIEDNYLVVEINPGVFANLPIELAPTAKEGDVISIFVNMEETNSRKEKISNLVNQLFED